MYSARFARRKPLITFVGSRFGGVCAPFGESATAPFAYNSMVGNLISINR